MAFIKKHWLYLTLGVIALGSIGTGAWGYLAGDAIMTQLQEIERVRGDVQKEGQGAQNQATIEAKKAEQAAQLVEEEKALQAGLAAQSFNLFEGRERQLLVPEALPNPKNNAVRFDFRTAYRNAFAGLAHHLHARGAATPSEVTAQDAIIHNHGREIPEEDRGFWMPKPQAAAANDQGAPEEKEASMLDILKLSAATRAAELAARTAYMYLDNGAFEPHPMLESEEAPNATAIWHAQMTLWIQQDIAAAISRLNDARAEKLKSEGRAYDCWVAHMPVKHLKRLSSAGWLGRGGGTNSIEFPKSFMGTANDASKFVVPIQIDLVIEEASIMNLLDSLCRVGYYTPHQVKYRRVPPNPAQDEFIYGESPVVEVVIDIEGVYFRKVFDAWIPKELAPILSRPEAKEEPRR